MKNYMEFIISVLVLTASIGLDVFVLMYGRLTEISLLSIVSSICLLAGPLVGGIFLTRITGERLMEKDEEL